MEEFNDEIFEEEFNLDNLWGEGIINSLKKIEGYMMK